MIRRFLPLSILALLAALPVRAQDPGPSVLLVTAHPDDDAIYSTTVWRIVREHGGTADLAVVTDGAGGYRFSTLAEPLYGIRLTDPEVARTAIPPIRRKEVEAGGSIVGIRSYFFLDQPDTGKFLDVDSVFTFLWNGDEVTRRLADLIRAGEYDMVFTMLPYPGTHAHHKASAIMAIRAVLSLPEAERPLVVAASVGEEPDNDPFEVLEGYPETRILKENGPWVFDRDTRLGLDDRLSYRIINQWVISEHKSQGTMQMYINGGRYERYWPYAMNTEEALRRAERLFGASGLVRPHS